MKKLLIILLIPLLMSCLASKLTTTGTLPESKPWEIVMGTVVIGGMVILFYYDIEKY